MPECGGSATRPWRNSMPGCPARPSSSVVDRIQGAAMDDAAQFGAALKHLTEALAAPVPAHELYQRVVDEALRLTSAETAVLCMLTEAGDQLDFVAVAGADARQVVGLRIRVADSISESALRSRRPVLLDSRQLAETGDLFAPSSRRARDRVLQPPLDDRAATGQVRSAAVAPIMVADRPVGTLLVQCESGAPDAPRFGHSALDILSALASLVSVGIHVSQATDRVCDLGRELAVLYD